MRIRATGKLRRFKYIKSSSKGNIMGLLADYIADSLHREGKLSEEFYYPETAAMFFEEGELPEIGPRAKQLHFGKSGRAGKHLWASIPDGSRVTIDANVDPWHWNGLGGTTTRIFSLVAEDNADDINSLD